MGYRGNATRQIPNEASFALGLRAQYLYMRCATSIIYRMHTLNTEMPVIATFLSAVYYPILNHSSDVETAVLLDDRHIVGSNLASFFDPLQFMWNNCKTDL